jgi:ankyrin repeat protein
MGNLEICALLLEHGAELNAVDNEGKTPLMNAAYNKKKEIAAFLIEKGADLDLKEANGWTALMLAAMGGEAEIVWILLNAGADVNLTTNDGETPLDRAKKLESAGMRGDYDTIVVLLKNAGGR